MNREKVLKVSEVMGFSPKALQGKYISKLLIESEGVGSSKLTLVHATMKPGVPVYPASAHEPPYDEAYYILQGQGRVEFGPDGEEAYDVEPNVAVFIPAGTMHRILNTGTKDLVFLGISPLLPTREGINGVYDERIKEWGTSFRKVISPESASS